MVSKNAPKENYQPHSNYKADRGSDQDAFLNVSELIEPPKRVGTVAIRSCHDPRLQSIIARINFSFANSVGEGRIAVVYSLKQVIDRDEALIVEPQH
jgi:hypothetical protein